MVCKSGSFGVIEWRKIPSPMILLHFINTRPGPVCKRMRKIDCVKTKFLKTILNINKCSSESFHPGSFANRVKKKHLRSTVFRKNYNWELRDPELSLTVHTVFFPYQWCNSYKLWHSGVCVANISIYCWTCLIDTIGDILFHNKNRTTFRNYFRSKF